MRHAFGIWLFHATAPGQLRLKQAFGTFARLAGLVSMLDLPDQRSRLALADYHVSEGERRLSRQIACLAYCRAAGHDTDEAERRLGEIEKDLVAWQAQRADILRTSTAS